MVLSATGVLNFYGLSACMGIWLDNPTMDCQVDLKSCDFKAAVANEVLKISPIGSLASILMNASAVGFFWGITNNSDHASAGVSAFQFYLSA